ncbi:MAG: hypothetical protein AAF438_22790 [Pseudomonadota bacterium]
MKANADCGWGEIACQTKTGWLRFSNVGNEGVEYGVIGSLRMDAEVAWLCDSMTDVFCLVFGPYELQRQQ